MLKRIMQIAQVALFAIACAAPAAAAPPWCKYARSMTEQTICNAAELWPLDACEDRLFRALRSKTVRNQAKELDQSERAWTAERDRCGADAACIAARYRERAAHLDPRRESDCVRHLFAQAEKPQLPATVRLDATCRHGALAEELAPRIAVTADGRGTIHHGGTISVRWRFPVLPATTARVFLIGAMPETVRFEGDYRFAADGALEGGPGFVALTGNARAPFDIRFGAGRTRIVIPIHDPDVGRTGTIRIKPYVAGTISIDWALVTLEPGCKDAPSIRRLAASGPFDVTAGGARIVVQDFVTPDPKLELATPGGTQRLEEVAVSTNGRYRLEVFERRYRVFDRTSDAKLVDRSGVKPRFSPGGRFVLASIGDAEKMYPTNFEVVDLVAGRVVARVGGPIIGWSNGDALLVDAHRAYQGFSLFNTLIDPVPEKGGTYPSWLYFFPGCGTCDAWANSNLRFDWDRMAVLRSDGGEPRAMGIASLATGRKVETTSFGDDEAVPLHERLRALYGKPDLPLTKGWSGNAAFALTHVGRGYDGYTDEDASLQPSEAGRPSQVAHLAPRRLALAAGKVLIPEDLGPARAVRSNVRETWGAASPTGPQTLAKGYVADELVKLGLRLEEDRAIPELPIPEAETPGGSDPLIRPWPKSLKAEILAADASLVAWFGKSDFPGIVVAAWRFEHRGTRYLLLQHGEPAMTTNGAHQLHFHLLALDGTRRGQKREIKDLGGLYSQFVGRSHTVARVSTFTNGHLVVAVPGTGRAAIVDLDNDQPPVALSLSEPTLLCGLLSSPSRPDLVVQSNCDGQLFVFRPAAASAPILSGRVVDNELILYTRHGYYSATYEGAHFVHVSFPGRPGVYSFEQFRQTLERPDLIRAIIDGRSLEVPAPRIAEPPFVELKTAPAGTAVEMTVTAASSIGLAAYELYLDGRLHRRWPLEGTRIERRERIEIPPHARQLTVVAIDTLGIVSRPATISRGKPAKVPASTLHVVAVGIDAYAQLTPLAGARLDAETLVRALAASAPYYGQVKSTIRTDRDATREVVERDLRTAVEAAGPGDTVLFFFAGHGGTERGHYYMALSESDPDHLSKTAIDWQNMAALLGATKGRAIAVIDACHAGQTGLAEPSHDAAVASLARSSKAPVVVLAASKGRQLSEEMPPPGGGVFTQSLARLLTTDRVGADSDRDGLLEVSELYRSLKQAVELRTSGRQTPWLVRRNMVGDAPLF